MNAKKKVDDLIDWLDVDEEEYIAVHDHLTTIFDEHGNEQKEKCAVAAMEFINKSLLPLDAALLAGIQKVILDA